MKHELIKKTATLEMDEGEGMGTPPPNEQRIVLENISWQKFETLLEELGPERTTRFTYDRGRLELMTPLEEHDRARKLIESLILVLADEMQTPVASQLAPTFKQPELGRAVEPDVCYYVQSQSRMQFEPPIANPALPDLIQETILNKGTLDRLSIYASFGIPEVWRYVSQAGEDFWKGRLVIYRLQGDRYAQSAYSQVFPFLSEARVQEFIEQSDAIGLVNALKVLRVWAEGAIV